MVSLSDAQLIVVLWSIESMQTHKVNKVIFGFEVKEFVGLSICHKLDLPSYIRRVKCGSD